MLPGFSYDGAHNYVLYMKLNKFEIIGIFLSVGVMALALMVVRLETDSATDLALVDSATQSAVVVATQDDESSLKNALVDAATTKGELVKLVVDDIKIGSGAEVKEGNTVTVHYIGTTQDGVQFDSSYTRGEPFSFTVGAKKVIEGWEKGLVGMKEGGQRILVIPSSMAYGDRQVGPIPAGSTLVFAVELLKVE